MSQENERLRKRRRLLDRSRMRRRAYYVLQDWAEATKRADYLSRCPSGCVYCPNPRRIRKGEGIAKLTRAEHKSSDSFREQLREHLTGEAYDLGA